MNLLLSCWTELENDWLLATEHLMLDKHKQLLLPSFNNPWKEFWKVHYSSSQCLTSLWSSNCDFDTSFELLICEAFLKILEKYPQLPRQLWNMHLIFTNILSLGKNKQKHNKTTPKNKNNKPNRKIFYLHSAMK